MPSDEDKAASGSEEINTNKNDEEDEFIIEHISYTPCTSMSWASVPRPILPKKEEYDPVEKFVYDAVSFRSLIDRSQMDLSTQKAAGLGYKAILDLLRKRDDPEMLKKVLLALRTSGEGTTMGKIISDSKRHRNLLHLIFRLDPFLSPDDAKPSTESNTKDIPFDWSLADAYLNLIVALVSFNSVFLTPALNMLWRLIQCTDAITPEDRQLVQFIDENTSMTEEQIENVIEQQFQRNSRLHGALSKILHLVPNGNSEIFPVIASSFPFKLSPLQKQACYVKQCFIVLNYVPIIRRNILELCIDKCLEIDVEIRIAQDGIVKIEEVKEEDGDDHVAPFKMDEDGDDKNIINEKEKEIKDKFKAEKTSAEQVDEFAEKLDTLMFLIFQHLVTTSESDAKDSAPRDLYKMVIFSFDSVILTTHRSKFVQFVILFLCGLDHEKHSNDDQTNKEDEESTSEQFMLSREFAAKLIELVLDPFRPGINRQSAACYLASFVSRSMYVCAGTACEAVSALLRFAEAYMDTYHTEALARNARRGADDAGIGVSKVTVHGLFYTVCQAAFYIMCFRGKECIDHYKKAVEYHRNLESSNEDVDVLLYSDPRLIDISSKRWTRLVSHHLHPLKYCLESVRGEFLLLSDRFDLIESEVLRRLIIEDRKMASGLQKLNTTVKKPSSIRTAATLERRRTSGGVGGLGRGSNPLDSFFPFDPYLLRRSYAFIDPHYRHWAGSPSAEDLAEEESGNEEIWESIHGDSSDDEDDDDTSVQSNENDDDDDDDDEASIHDHSFFEASSEGVAMSLTSTTCSILEGDDTDNEVTADDMAVPKDTWVAELKRARAQSIEDCW